MEIDWRGYWEELKDVLWTVLVYAAVLGMAPLLSWLVNGKPRA